MIRRTFLKGFLAGAGASMIDPGILAAGTVKKSESVPRSVRKKVIVGGAGITGLCCAYELMKAGCEVTVLEAAGRYSGHVFTGRDGLSDGLYADFGADHITKPGYERLFAYTEEFRLPVLAYPNAEGSPLPRNNGMLTLMGGKFYTEEMLANPKILKSLGFNPRETEFLSKNPWYELAGLYLGRYVDKIRDPYRPFGIGLDHLDTIPVADLYKQQGASPRALDYLGGEHTSALYYVWRLAVMKARGIPLSEGETFRLQGGNEQLPIAFAKRLGSRVKLAHPITGITHDENGVTVKYRAYNYDEEKSMQADYFVNCITLTIFRNIPISPGLSPEKQYIVDNLTYTSHPFYVFEASSRFWLADGFKTLNMEFDHPDISSIWEVPNEVDTTRAILKAYGPSGLSPLRVLAAFRAVYPGKRDTIVQALTKDWAQNRHAPNCEMEPFPMGEMHKFWPEILKPEGRIYFAGTYADALSRGQESCIRSAQRVAREIVAA
jgi:monoamine oxidase